MKELKKHFKVYLTKGGNNVLFSYDFGFDDRIKRHVVIVKDALSSYACSYLYPYVRHLMLYAFRESSIDRDFYFETSYPEKETYLTIRCYYDYD